MQLRAGEYPDKKMIVWLRYVSALLPAWLWICAGIVVFYEGIPFARQIPHIDRLDFLGPFIAGRVEQESRAAVKGRDDWWNERIQEAEARLEKERQEKQARIDQLEKEFLEAEETATQKERELVTQLDRAIERERQNDEKACFCIDKRVPSGILRNLR